MERTPVLFISDHARLCGCCRDQHCCGRWAVGDLGILLWVLSADWSLSWVQGSCGPKPAVKLSCSISPTGGDWGPFTLLGLCGGPRDPIVVRGCYGLGGQVTQSPRGAGAMTTAWGGHRPQAQLMLGP